MSVPKEKKILVPSDHDNLGNNLVANGYVNVWTCSLDPNEIASKARQHDVDYIVSAHPISCPPGYRGGSGDFGVPGIVSICVKE